jgi:hypothetical protein
MALLCDALHNAQYACRYLSIWWNPFTYQIEMIIRETMLAYQLMFLLLLCTQYLIIVLSPCVGAFPLNHNYQLLLPLERVQFFLIPP